MADLEALAGQLAATARDLQTHIEARAGELAQPRVEQERMTCARIVAEQRAEMESMRQRKEDLIVEPRRQLDAQVRQVGRLLSENKALRAAVGRVEALKVWTNEDGKQFVFADELWDALAEAGPRRFLAADSELGRRTLPGDTDKEGH